MGESIEVVRGTTPTFQCRIPGADLSDVRSLFVTIKQNGKRFTLTGNDLTVTGAEHNVIECYLRQEDSLKLAVGIGQIQANWTYLDIDEVTVRRAGTKPKQFVVDEQLLDQLLS